MDSYKGRSFGHKKKISTFELKSAFPNEPIPF